MTFPAQRLLDAVYSKLGVPATLGDVAVTVRDDTRGITASNNGLGIETVGPSARGRMQELTDNNIELSSLTDNTIIFNGNSWRIKTYREMPSPNGISDGQIRLMLLSEG